MKIALNLYRELLQALPTDARRFLNVYATLLASLAVFDAAALALLAVVIGPLSVGNAVTLPLVGTLDSAGVVVAILVICALMITKGALSALVMRWGSQRIANYEVALGDRLFRAYLGASWQERLTKNSTDMLRFTDGGVDAAVNSFIRPGATLLGEVVSMVVMVGTIAIVQPLIALVTLVYLLALAAVLYLWIARHSRRAGEINVESTIRTSRLILEVMSALKEVTLRRKEPEVAEVVERSRTRSARARANIYFLGQVPRYVLESGIIGGFIVVGGAGFLIGGQEQAITAVALFALAGFRMAPSVIRFQAAISQMLAASIYPRRVIDELTAAEHHIASVNERPTVPLPSPIHRISFRDVTFGYDATADPAVEGVSFDIDIGTSVAFVGSSGSGKSTLVDLLLGLLEPQSGRIEIDGLDVQHVARAWRDHVAYVPQEVALFDASLAQNVALTWTDDYDEQRVIEALQSAHVWDIVASRRDGIRGSVGERGMALSGGQRQRIGIARALYSDPLVLVMDEATSALDTQTEAAVSDSIRAMTGERTIVTVAHRLATVKHADQIFFMKGGRLVHSGTFDEVVAAVPDFARQAALAGLAPMPAEGIGGAQPSGPHEV
ncbi:ABC transporter ATP-binding protein [Microbacterium sp. J1-1]|uniref:ABC transporter ATP-binding protein n=1 Tax=Microbacterium sp. J1-1 TaxID=2992441 RepID=UPI00211441E2|nr:ABC transporter ATP-binding protein [Microbacterium sp. J1-1]UUE21913.1 ABC transporter ATP-binding protein/permease [Microbacterium sp. J1-1]